MRPIEYFNRGKRHVKTLVLSEYRLHQQRYHRAHALHMTNHSNGRETELTISEMQFGSRLTPQDFERHYFAQR